VVDQKARLLAKGARRCVEFLFSDFDRPPRHYCYPFVFRPMDIARVPLTPTMKLREAIGSSHGRPHETLNRVALARWASSNHGLHRARGQWARPSALCDPGSTEVIAELIRMMLLAIHFAFEKRTQMQWPYDLLARVHHMVICNRPDQSTHGNKR